LIGWTAADGTCIGRRAGGSKEGQQMGTTRQIPRDEWREYFGRFTQEYLDAKPEEVTMEVLSPAIGGQFEARFARLDGIAYDPDSSAFEVWVEEPLDHLALYPTEIWVDEEEGGFISMLEIVRPDGPKEVLSIQRRGPPARLQGERSTAPR
jgi:hypothetical protein